MLRAPLGLVAAVSLAACSGGGSGPDAQQVRLELDESFGGYTSSAEEPHFADPAVLAVPALATTFASQEPAAGSSAPTRTYRVALVWGHFPAANDESDGDVDAHPATWAGFVAVDAGAIDVERTLSFDAGDAIASRATPLAVAFVSHTLPFVDGLLLRVTARGASPALHFATSILTTDVRLDVVAGGPGLTVQAAGDQGLAVVVCDDTAGACDGGVAYGRWVKLHAAVGVLRARLVAFDGTDRGFAAGIWGHASSRDADLFFGKAIDPAGAFSHLFEGTYAAGALHGTIGDAVTQNGSFDGVYSDGLDLPDGRGVFLAKWITH